MLLNLEFSLGSSVDGDREQLRSKRPFKLEPEEESNSLLARFHFKITRDRLYYWSVDVLYSVYIYLDKDNLNRQHYIIGDIFRLNKLLNAVDCQPADCFSSVSNGSYRGLVCSGPAKTDS